MSVRTITVLEDALRKELALLIEQRDSLAAEIAGLRAQVMHEGERLERAEQERNEALQSEDVAERYREAAEARAQKAEADNTRLREALEEIADTSRHKRGGPLFHQKDWRMGFQIARAALPEEPA